MKLFRFAFLFSLAVAAVAPGLTHAQMCDSKVTSPAEDASKPTFSAARMWLQWLNQGSFSCAAVGGDNNHVRCTQGSTWYDAIMVGCAGSPVSCTVRHFDRNSTTVIRNTSLYAPSATWNFTFQGGPAGYVTMSCIPDLNHLGNPCLTTYGTCIQ